ncbi:MAG: hypothetical protein ACYDAN_05695 [Candidatus Limnocylindrales bacterium]
MSRPFAPLSAFSSALFSSARPRCQSEGTSSGAPGPSKWRPTAATMLVAASDTMMSGVSPTSAKASRQAVLFAFGIARTSRSFVTPGAALSVQSISARTSTTQPSDFLRLPFGERA